MPRCVCGSAACTSRRPPASTTQCNRRWNRERSVPATIRTITVTTTSSTSWSRETLDPTPGTPRRRHPEAIAEGIGQQPCSTIESQSRRALVPGSSPSPRTSPSSAGNACAPRFRRAGSAGSALVNSSQLLDYEGHSFEPNPDRAREHREDPSARASSVHRNGWRRRSVAHRGYGMSVKDVVGSASSRRRTRR